MLPDHHPQVDLPLQFEFAKRALFWMRGARLATKVSGWGSMLLQLSCLSTTSYYFLQLPITFYYFLLLSTTSYCFLLLPITFYYFLLLPIISYYFLLLPITSYYFLLSLVSPAVFRRSECRCFQHTSRQKLSLSPTVSLCLQPI